ncbi:DUF535 family protein, partial [Salmonella enterica]
HQQKGMISLSPPTICNSANGVKKGALYHLPSQVMRKAPESIPSKKRAEYRKRYHILDTIIQEVNSLSR